MKAELADYVSTRAPDDDPDLVAKDGIVVDTYCGPDSDGEYRYLVARNIRGRFVSEWFDESAIAYTEPTDTRARHIKVWLAIETLWKDKPKMFRELRPDEVKMLGWAHFLAACVRET